MTRQVRSTLVITLSFLLLVTGLALAAPQGQHGYGPGARGFGAGDRGPLMGIFRELDLTEGQREQLRATVREQMEGELGELTRNQFQARRELQKLIHDPSTEESAIVDAVQANAITAEQLALARHRLVVSMFEVLTEDQREQALTRLEQMPDDEFQPRRRGRRGGPPSGE